MAWPGDTPSQLRHRGVAAVQHLVEHAPASGSLALWVEHEDVQEDADGQGEGAPRTPAGPWVRGGRLRHTPAPVTTDGHTLRYDLGFEDLPLAQQAGWVAHAVLHVALRHVPRREALAQRLGDVDDALFNLCADAIVNTALDPLPWLQLPDGAVRLEQVLAHALGVEASAEAALQAWDVERLYGAVDDRAPTPGRDGRRPDGRRAARLRAMGRSTAPDLKWPQPGDPDHAPEREAELSRDWRERLLRGQAGDGAQSLVRGLMADLPAVRTPWEQLLRTQCARALSRKAGLSWSRPARTYLARQGRWWPGGPRMAWEPGTTASRAVPRLAVVLDVSGSIDDRLLSRFAGEVAAISRRLEAPLTLVVGDCAVRQEVDVPPGGVDLQAFTGAGFGSGGDTDFTPLLQAAARRAPDLIVVLTDLDGPARHRPRCPVLWAVPHHHRHAQAPFGRLLVLD